MEKLQLSAGDYLYRSGDSSSSVYLVRRGLVELTTDYPETGEGVDSSLGVGHVFGEAELVDGSLRNCNARAARETELLVFSRDEMLDILFEHPERSLILGRSVFERLRELYSNDSLESDLERLRQEMQANIRQAIVAHESRVVRSHNGMAAILVPILLLIPLAVGSYWWFHRG